MNLANFSTLNTGLIKESYLGKQISEVVSMNRYLSKGLFLLHVLNSLRSKLAAALLLSLFSASSLALLGSLGRSEERRVGMEGRCGGVGWRGEMMRVM